MNWEVGDTNEDGGGIRDSCDYGGRKGRQGKERQMRKRRKTRVEKKGRNKKKISDVMEKLTDEGH